MCVEVVIVVINITTYSFNGYYGDNMRHLRSMNILWFLFPCRIASDLLLWEPTAPSPVDRSDIHGTVMGGLDLASQLLQGPDKFVMCRSGLHSYDGKFSISQSTILSINQSSSQSIHQ